MKEEKYLYNNRKIIIGGILFFLTCLIILTTATRSKAAGTNPIEITGAESVNLQLKVESQNNDEGDKAPLANVGFKVAKQPEGSGNISEFLLLNGSNGTYTFSSKITEKEAQATQMNTNSEGILNINNLPEGYYFLYESQLSAENVSFIQPISIYIRNNDGKLIVTINSNDYSKQNTITVGEGTDPVTINITHTEGDYTNPSTNNCIVSRSVSGDVVVTTGTNTSLKIKKEFEPDTLDNWEVHLKVGVNILGNNKAGTLKEDKSGFDTYQEVTLSKETKGNIIELNDSDSWSACYENYYGDDNKIYVEIIEEDGEDYKAEFSSNAEGLIQEGNKYSGTIENANGKEIVITIKNAPKTNSEQNPELKTGDLTVRKIVSGKDKDKQTDFNFTVTLSDKSINGEYGEMTFKDGIATFTLKHDESKTAVNLPAGITYEITEESVKKFDVDAENEKGTIEAGKEMVAKFVNMRNDILPNTSDVFVIGLIIGIISLGTLVYFQINKKSMI